MKADRRAMRRQVIREDIATTKRKLNQHIEDMVKDGEADAGEIEQAQQLANHILDKNLGLLKANPSTQNIGNVLDALKDAALLGAGTDSGPSAQAMNALQEAQEQRREKSEQRFRRSPSSKNLEKLLDETRLTVLLGGKGESKRPGWTPAGGKHHTTSKDTLSGLSKKYYGSPGFWDIIFFENLGSIGLNPDVLHDGIDLVIP